MSERAYIESAVSALEAPSEPSTAGQIEYRIRQTFRTLAGIYGREGARLRVIEIMEDETARRRN